MQLIFLQAKFQLILLV